MRSWIQTGWRQVRNQQANSLLVVLTLGLGMTGIALVLAIADGLLFRALPFPANDRLALLWTTPQARPAELGLSSPALLNDLQSTVSGLETVGGFYFENLNLSRLPGGDLPAPERVRAIRTTPGFFATLGLSPAMGRLPLPQEELVGASKTVVLSWDFFQQRLGGNAEVLNQDLVFSGAVFRVLGVLPRDFRFPTVPAAVFAPAQLHPNLATARSARFLHILATRKAAMSPFGLEQELLQMNRKLAETYGAEESGLGIAIQPLRDYLVGADTQRALSMVSGAVLLLLAVAIFNCSSLLLARSLYRQREHAMKLALGATGGRLAIEVAVETLLLATMAAGVGAMISQWGIDLVRQQWTSLPTFWEPALDGRVILMVSGIAGLAGMIAALLPGWAVSHVDVLSTLRRTGGGANRGGQGWARGAMVSLQLAGSLVLLTASLSLGWQWHQQRLGPIGFRTQGIQTFAITLPWETPFAEQISFFRQLRLEFQESPQVAKVAYASCMPFDMESVQGYRAEGSIQKYAARACRVSADYFEAIDMRLLQGRAILESDGPGREEVVVLNESAARQWFPGGRALGRMLSRPWGAEERSARVIGIVADVPARPGQPGGPAVYESFQSSNWPSPVFYVQARTASAGLVITDLRQRLNRVRAGQALHTVSDLDTYLSQQNSGALTTFLLIGSFGTVAALLCAIGLYGVLNWFLAERRAELSLRLALGATPAQAAIVVLRQCAIWLGAGLSLGYSLLALSSLREELTLGLMDGPVLPAALIGGIGLFCLSLLITAYPLWQALRLDPRAALAGD